MSRTKRHLTSVSRNNHLRQHREQLREAANKFTPPARLLALNWSFDLPLSTIHRICGDRILARGDRHQSLVADDTKSHEEVVWQFLKNAEELTDAEADVVATMNVEEPLEDALARAVGVVVKYLGLPQPDVEQMGQALAVARGYEPASRARRSEKAKGKGEQDDSKAVQAQGHSNKGKKAKGPAPPRYYGILAEVDLRAVVGAAFAGVDVPGEGKAFWEKLCADRRVQQRPHVTLVHSKSLPAESEMWERCRALAGLPQPPLLSFRLGHVVWNERVMAATVVDLAAEAVDDEADKAAVKFVLGVPEEVKNRLHITVGTRHQSVPPVEGKDLVMGWKTNGAGNGVWAMPLKDVWVKGRVKGLNS